jgi:hypothetical protein
MTIYNNRVPYTYLIGWTSLNTWYYGRRTKAGCHPSEFWVKYFTSSSDVSNFRNKHGEPDVIQVRKTFKKNNAITECIKHEVTVIRRIKAVQNTNWLNKGNAGIEFDTTGKVIAKNLETGKSVVVELTEFKLNPTKLVGINSGIQFKKLGCIWCNKEIPINNITNHELYCCQNPNKITHHRIGVALSDEIKEKMSANHTNVSGKNNPKAKKWILTSPNGEVTNVQGNLNQTLADYYLSRNHLIANLGKAVEPVTDIRSEKTKRTFGWKLELKHSNLM